MTVRDRDTIYKRFLKRFRILTPLFYLFYFLWKGWPSQLHYDKQLEHLQATTSLTSQAPTKVPRKLETTPNTLGAIQHKSQSIPSPSSHLKRKEQSTSEHLPTLAPSAHTYFQHLGSLQIELTTLESLASLQPSQALHQESNGLQTK